MEFHPSKSQPSGCRWQAAKYISRPIDGIVRTQKSPAALPCTVGNSRVCFLKPAGLSKEQRGVSYPCGPRRSSLLLPGMLKAWRAHQAEVRRREEAGEPPFKTIEDFRVEIPDALRDAYRHRPCSHRVACPKIAIRRVDGSSAGRR